MFFLALAVVDLSSIALRRANQNGMWLVCTVFSGILATLCGDLRWQAVPREEHFAEDLARDTY